MKPMPDIASVSKNMRLDRHRVNPSPIGPLNKHNNK